MLRADILGDLGLWRPSERDILVTRLQQPEVDEQDGVAGWRGLAEVLFLRTRLGQVSYSFNREESPCVAEIAYGLLVKPRAEVDPVTASVGLAALHRFVVRELGPSSQTRPLVLTMTELTNSLTPHSNGSASFERNLLVVQAEQPSSN